MSVVWWINTKIFNMGSILCLEYVKVSVNKVKMVSKGNLEVILSKLDVFNKPKVRLEQYAMDSKIGAEILWNAFLSGEIEGVIADLGCGTGILGIGALLLGAKRVFFVDIDENALKIAKSNLKIIKSEFNIGGEAVFICKDVADFNEKVNLVLQNPPFGIKVRNSDRIFLKKAMELAPLTYSFHKIESKKFIEGFCKENKHKVSNIFEFNYPIKAEYEFHKKRIHRFKVGCWKIVKI